jgi:glutathionyl-hydroquinone reductase
VLVLPESAAARLNLIGTNLYISLACPWACRTLIFRKFKKLENVISISVVDPFTPENILQHEIDTRRLPG